MPQIKPATSILYFLLFSFPAFCQPCVGPEIYLFSQRDIDRFYVDYSGVSCVDGDIMIQEDFDGAILNLHGLAHLKKITGRLDIRRANGLKNLDGLEGLDSVDFIAIYSADSLRDIKALQNIKNLNGIIISPGKRLIAIDTFYHLDSIGLVAVENTSLVTDLAGFSLIDKIDRLSIDGNSGLTTLDGLPELFRLSRLSIQNNPALTDIHALQSIKEIPNITISNNAQLTNLDGLSALEKTGILNIYGNSSLVSIEGLNQLNPQFLYDISITENPMLTECQVIPFCKSIISFTYGPNISNNGTGCSSPMEFRAACIDQLSCNDDIVLQSQSDLEFFAQQYANCDSLHGDLIISSTNITSLQALENIKFIGGNLIIIWNDSLFSLAGLEQLTTVVGDVQISGNSITSLQPLGALTQTGSLRLYGLSILSMEGLELLSHIKGNLSIENCDFLQNLHALHRIKVIDGKLTIAGNPMLDNLSGLDSLQQTGSVSLAGLNIINVDGFPQLISVAGTITVSNMNNMISIHAFDNLATCGGLVITKNNKLFNLVGFQHIDTINGNLLIEDNPMLNSLSGFQGKYIAGEITISSNASLESIQALNSISSCNGLVIQNNSFLTSLTGLDSLQYIRGRLLIIENPLLISVSGLKAVKKVDGNLTISNCASLTQLDAMSQVDTIIGNIFIDNTPITSIMAFSQLIHLGGELKIEDNNELVTIEGFEQTKTIGGIRIERNNKLAVLSNFELLDSLTGILKIEDAIISFLPAMSNLQKTSAEIVLDDLSSLIGAPFLEHLQDIGGLRLGDIGLDTLRCSRLKHNHGVLSITTTGLDFMEMDSLQRIENDLAIRNSSLEQIRFPLLDYIGGDLYIVNNDQLTDITGLQSLRHIDDKLVISENAVLQSLQGLHQVNPDSMNVSNSYIYNLVVTITNNPLLEECSIPPVCGVINSPSKRTELFGNRIGCNNEVEIVTACESLHHCIADSLVLGTQAEINSFPSHYSNCRDIQGTIIVQESEPGNIVQLDSLVQIQRIGKSLIIRNNTLLSDLSGLDSLSRLGGKLIISGNPSLTNLMALDQLLPNLPIQYTTADSAFRISNNPLLSKCNIPFVCDVLTIPETEFGLQDNLEGCNTAEEIQLNCNYSLSCDFAEAYSQTIIDEFPIRYPNCKHLLNGLQIDSYEGDIFDLTPLSQLASLNGSLSIGFTHLQDLGGLENISTISGRIFIDWNSSLVDISALNQVDPGSLRPSGKNKIFLNQNHSLSDCATELICEILLGSEDEVTISKNNAGCNSASEVLEQCIVGTISSTDHIKVLIYPNPTNDIIYLESLSDLATSVRSITLVDMQGRNWWSGPFANMIDVSNLPEGVYGLILHTAQMGPLSFKIIIQ